MIEWTVNNMKNGCLSQNYDSETENKDDWSDNFDFQSQ